MKKYQIYIIGLLALFVGFAIGWFIKPADSDMVHQHTGQMENASENEIWTCSMHPQIRQPEPGLCPICEMDLIPLENSQESDDPTILSMSKEAVKMAQIETITVGTNTVNSQLAETIVVDGTIELDERTVNSQTSHIKGRIESMQITFKGQYVQKGQIIATIFSTELLAASEELLTASKINDRIEGVQEATIQKLKNWKITDRQIQQILESKKPLETINIYADFSGYVLNKMVAQGDYVSQGQPLYTLGKTGNLWLVFNVYESDLSEIKRGQIIHFTTPSIPGKSFESRISYINPLLDEKTRTATIRAEINNRNNLLKPGMLINGRIQVSHLEESQNLTVPNSAILWTGNKSVVYVLLPDYEVPTYQFREVEVVSRGQKHSTISKGINAGDQVVTEGAFALDASAQLNNNFSMMNRNVKVKDDKISTAPPDYTSEVTDSFLFQLDQLVIAYISLKNDLVATKPQLAAQSASNMLEKIGKVNMMELKGEAHNFWMEKQKAITAHAENIANEEKSIEYQRDQFDFLSEALISTLKSFGTNEKEYYVQYCPMAKNDQGANWISEEKQIRNPYFGDKMMKCGIVTVTLN